MYSSRLLFWWVVGGVGNVWDVVSHAPFHPRPSHHTPISPRIATTRTNPYHCAPATPCASSHTIAHHTPTRASPTPTCRPPPSIVRWGGLARVGYSGWVGVKGGVVGGGKVEQ